LPVLREINTARDAQESNLGFNTNLPALKLTLAHTWEWEPKTGKVTFEGKDKDGKPVKVTYLRSQLNSQPANVKDEIDPAFMNDQYWLVFPFHVMWDTSADVQDKGKQKLPLGKGTADQIIVTYSSDVGYTPGDTWELFLDSGNRVRGIGLQEGRSSTCLDGTSRNGRRQASAGVLLGRSRQAG
jgi:hypothetical protein